MSKQFDKISLKTESKLETISSPVVSYNILNSPDQKITMVESQITKKEYVSENPGLESILKDNLTSADKSKISASGYSGFRAPSEVESITSSIKEGFSYAKYGVGSLTDSVKLTQQQQPPQSLIYQSGYNVSSTQPGLNPTFQPTGNYQIGTSYLGGKSY